MMTMKKKIMTMMLMALCGIAVAEAQPHRGFHPVVINPRPMHIGLTSKEISLFIGFSLIL